jgi:hypothetical protein
MRANPSAQKIKKRQAVTCRFLADDYNFDTKFIVRGNHYMNCLVLYNSNYNNLPKRDPHILTPELRANGRFFRYRLKSTTENNALARARANDKRRTNPCL